MAETRLPRALPRAYGTVAPPAAADFAAIALFWPDVGVWEAATYQVGDYVAAIDSQTSTLIDDARGAQAVFARPSGWIWGFTPQAATRTLFTWHPQTQAWYTLELADEGGGLTRYTTPAIVLRNGTEEMLWLAVNEALGRLELWSAPLDLSSSSMLSSFVPAPASWAPGSDVLVPFSSCAHSASDTALMTTVRWSSGPPQYIMAFTRVRCTPGGSWTEDDTSTEFTEAGLWRQAGSSAMVRRETNIGPDSFSLLPPTYPADVWTLPLALLDDWDSSEVYYLDHPLDDTDEWCLYKFGYQPIGGALVGSLWRGPAAADEAVTPIPILARQSDGLAPQLYFPLE